MPSPDFSSYVDLTLFDTSADAVLNSIIEHGRSVLPEWRPQVGNVEVMLAESFANETANFAAFINRLPNSTTEALLQLFKITRSDGTKATATATFTMNDTAGYTVPANTPVVNFTSAGISLVYLTDVDLVVANGSSTGDVAITAKVVGDDYNSPSAGAAMQVLATTPFVQSVTLKTSPTGGTNAESDDVYFDRASNLLTSYSSALATTNQIQSYVLANYSVYRCVVFDKRRYNDRDTTSPGYTTHPGYVLIAVANQNADQADTTDIPVTVAMQADIVEDLDVKTSGSVQIDIMSAELVSVDAVVDFQALPGFDADALETTVDEALQGFLDPNTWNWNQVVRINDLIALIDNIAGIDYVSNLTLNANTLIGPNPNFVDNAAVGIELDNLGTLVISGTHTITGTNA